MAKPTNPESGSLIDRFNRRREKVAAEARSDKTDEEHLVSKDLDDTDIADEEDALSDSELLKKYELPDPETVEDEAALDQFFEGDMPERLKRLALRRVWRLNPLFRFADEMVEYGEDYTDAATVVEGMQTAYEVGKGYLAKVKEALEGDVGDHDVIASETSTGFDNLDTVMRKTHDPQIENGKRDNLENSGKKEDEAREAPKSGPIATVSGGDTENSGGDTEKRVSNENDSGPQHQQGFDLTARKLSHYEMEEKIVENSNSREAKDGSQKEDQIRTVLEGAENQTVRPKKMIFKIPKS